MGRKAKAPDIEKYSDESYLRSLNVIELKFLLIFLGDDALVKEIIDEKASS